MKSSYIRNRSKSVAVLLLGLISAATLSAAAGGQRIEPDWFSRLGNAWVFNKGHGHNPGAGSFEVIHLSGSRQPAGKLTYDFTATDGSAYVGTILFRDGGAPLQVEGPLAEIRLTAKLTTPGVILLRLIDSGKKTFQYKLRHSDAGAAVDYKVDLARPSQVWGGPRGEKPDKTIVWPLHSVFIGVEKSGDRTGSGEALFYAVELITADQGRFHEATSRGMTSNCPATRATKKHV
ncbi:MAG: hypothetical protein LBK99_01835 [Opitutaceae bacterium]|jgi:hypothetical protein|nr:hypothetical protein [Opitutaceae bacterium]